MENDAPRATVNFGDRWPGDEAAGRRPVAAFWVLPEPKDGGICGFQVRRADKADMAEMFAHLQHMLNRWIDMECYECTCPEDCEHCPILKWQEAFRDSVGRRLAELSRNG